MDELRAQVLAHQRAARRRKVFQFFGWGVAGALAVALGGVLAGGLLPRVDAQLWRSLSSAVGQDASPSPTVQEAAAAPGSSPSLAAHAQIVSAGPSPAGNEDAGVMQGAERAQERQKADVPAAPTQAPVSLADLEKEEEEVPVEGTTREVSQRH